MFFGRGHVPNDQERMLHSPEFVERKPCSTQSVGFTTINHNCPLNLATGRLSKSKSMAVAEYMNCLISADVWVPDCSQELKLQTLVSFSSEDRQLSHVFCSTFHVVIGKCLCRAMVFVYRMIDAECNGWLGLQLFKYCVQPYLGCLAWLPFLGWTETHRLAVDENP